MNTDKHPNPTKTWNGSLVLGTLWGILVGYIVADFATGSHGQLWHLGSYSDDRSLVTWCILDGPGIGFVLGLAFDLVSSKSRHRKLIVNLGWQVLGWAFAIYIFWIILTPNVQGLRE